MFRLLVLLWAAAAPARAVDCTMAEYERVQERCNVTILGCEHADVSPLRRACSAANEEALKLVKTRLEKARSEPEVSAALKSWEGTFDLLMAVRVIRAQELAGGENKVISIEPHLGWLPGQSEVNEWKKAAQVRIAQPPGRESKPEKADAVSLVREARNQERAIQEKTPNDDKALAEVGEWYLRAGSPLDSQRVVDRALESNPDNPQALALRSYLRAHGGRGPEALADARKALERDPGNELAGSVARYLATAVGKAGNKGRLPGFVGGRLAASESSAVGAVGRAEPRRLTESFPTAAPPGRLSTTGPLRLQAAGKVKVGNLTGALLDATRAIEADRNDARAWALRALISNKLKNYHGAVKDAGEALKLDADDAAALLERGYAQLQLGNYQLALADIDRLLRLDSWSATGHLYRGMILEKLGRMEEALEEYRAAADLDVSLKPLADEAFARLRKGSRDIPAPPASPWSPKVGLLAILAALVFVWQGIRRVFKPGGITTTEAGRSLERAPRAESPAPAGTLPCGSVLAGNFRIERELGRGGMGIVYEATDLTLKRRVAIKHLRTEAHGSPEVRERFLREAQLAARLRHPNLAQIFSVVDAGELYLVFELVEGEALDRVLSREGRLALERVKGMVGDVCGALEHAHAHRVIHRDLKPANLMLAGDGTCKVMDFGIAHEARSMSAQTQTTPWGTPPYMAPEQEAGRVCGESDLYSLGVMTYEMLTGRRPFDGPFFLEKKLKKEFPPISALDRGLPRSLDAFFAKALDPEPSRRFRTAREFRDSFEAIGQTPARA